MLRREISSEMWVVLSTSRGERHPPLCGGATIQPPILMDQVNRRRGHRWFQLSLRSLFLLTLLVAAYFAGYRTALHQAEDAQAAQREARLSAERAAAEALKETQKLRVRYRYLQAVANYRAVQAQRVTVDVPNSPLTARINKAQKAQRGEQAKPKQAAELVEPEES
jgi:hypothetical protein